MAFHDVAGAAYRALTAERTARRSTTSAIPCCSTGPAATLIWRNSTRPRSATRRCAPLLRRTGLIELNDTSRLDGLREALVRARDDAAPDWAAIGAPVAELLDTIELRHKQARPAGRVAAPPTLSEIELTIRTCGAHLLALLRTKRLHPGLCRLQPDRRSGYAAAANS